MLEYQPDGVRTATNPYSTLFLNQLAGTSRMAWMQRSAIDGFN
jgi:hypothetical protein